MIMSMTKMVERSVRSPGSAGAESAQQSRRQRYENHGGHHDWYSFKKHERNLHSIAMGVERICTVYTTSRPQFWRY